MRLLAKISNRKVVRDWLRTHPETDDLKRAVLIEVFRAINGMKSPLTALQRGVYQDLLAAIQKRERSAIDEATKKVLVEAGEKHEKEEREMREHNARVVGEHRSKKP